MVMLCIMAHHYVVNSGITDAITTENVLSPNAVFALLFGWGGKTGINCFVLITGYYMCKSKISLKKYLKVHLEVIFYEFIFYSIFVLTGYEEFQLKAFLKSMLFTSYIGTEFISSYLVFFPFIPFLNLFIKAMNERQHRYLIGICLLTGSFLQTFLNAAKSFTYVGWFMALYLIASYIRLWTDGAYENKWLSRDFFSKRKLWGFATVLMLLLSWGSVLAGAMAYAIMGKRLYYHFVADSNKLLAVGTAICAFLFFKNLQMGYSKMINKIAASVFGVLMIHANSDAMRRLLWGDLFDNVGAFERGAQHMGPFILHALGSVLALYIICTLLDMVRIQLIEKPFFRWYDNRVKGCKKCLRLF